MCRLEKILHTHGYAPKQLQARGGPGAEPVEREVREKPYMVRIQDFGLDAHGVDISFTLPWFPW